MANISLSVVLPAHNEEENIANTVSGCLSYLSSNFSEYEVIVVNDGSRDRTRGIVEELSSKNPAVVLVNHEVNKGYGSALRSGFDKASLDYVFFMDSDGQFDIKDLDRLIPLTGGNNVVIGYRENRADSFIRSLNAWMYGLYIRLVFGLSVKDMDCAFKIFPTEAYRKVRPIKAGGALFSAEFLIKLKRVGYVFREVPVRHFPRKFGTQSGANLKVILRMFRESWKLRNELRNS
ncbi:MAG TPA: glycosyltransferase family 2 protein [Thermodesulfobacteriota bacterium]|mgnify:FL=1|nr:glycosyltransferase family 2 protein [Thermodesulfobacteriota bacterium]